MPGVEPNELAYLQSLTKDLTEDQLQTFAALYNGERKKSDTIMIGAIVGLLGVGGVQRFMIGQIGMGILYFLTLGLCYIGTIVDIVNYKKLTLEYNQQVANNLLRAAINMSK
ncbi:MAG: TM2 domain-containing protein [Chlorobi bacterium]|nr:TM2 domain-containing protein [Chlorobiota bacterium]